MKKTMQNLITMIVVFSICFLTGCVDGLLRDNDLLNIIYGMQCDTIHDNLYFYTTQTLTNNTSFDDEIIFDSYSKLTLLNTQNCKIKGLAFVVRSLQNATLNFSVLLHQQLILEKTYEFNSNLNQTVTLFFESSILVDETNKLIININQIFEVGSEINYEYTNLAFDSFLIFFEE
jgi:hypothetical protein